MFNTITEIKAANAARGNHFFSKGVMRVFHSRVSGRIYQRPNGGAYFITSERGPTGRRLYIVRQADPDGQCSTAAGTHQAFRTAKAAHAWAAEFCKETNR